MQHLSAPFVFQEDCRMEIEHVLFLSVFFTLRIRVSEGHFQCVHTIRFSEPTKIGYLKTNPVDGPIVSVDFQMVSALLSVKVQHQISCNLQS